MEWYFCFIDHCYTDLHNLKDLHIFSRLFVRLAIRLRDRGVDGTRSLRVNVYKRKISKKKRLNV